MDISIAEEIEFESWPEEQRKLAEKYLGVRLEIINNLQYELEHLEDIYHKIGYDEGVEVGRRDMRALWEKELHNLITRMNDG